WTTSASTPLSSAATPDTPGPALPAERRVGAEVLGGGGVHLGDGVPGVVRSRRDDHVHGDAFERAPLHVAGAVHGVVVGVFELDAEAVVREGDPPEARAPGRAGENPVTPRPARDTGASCHITWRR